MRHHRRRRTRRRYAPIHEDITPDPPPIVGSTWNATKDLSDPVWLKTGLSVGIDALSAPDGTATADKLMELVDSIGTPTAHHVVRSMPEAQTGQNQVVRFYAKQAERALLVVSSIDRTNLVRATRINLGTGQVETNPAGHVTTLTPIGQGWYFVKVVLSTPGTGAVVPSWRFSLMPASTSSLVYVGLPNAGLYLWDVQYHANTSGNNLVPEYSLSSSNRLRFGFFGAGKIVGQGPDGTAADAYGVAQFTPSFSTIDAVLDAALANDVLLMLNFARARGNWFTNGAFDFAKYETMVRQWESHARVRSLVKQRKVIAYVHDEANNNDFNGTLSPSLVNQSCRLHKDIWPGIITVVRMAPSTLEIGWDGFAPPRNGYDALDYAWSQFNGQHTPSNTFASKYADERAAAARVNVGLVLSLNLWNGGPTGTTKIDTVQPCWDYENNGNSSGYIIGTQDSSTLPMGTKVRCGDSRVTNGTFVVSPPAWIRRYADVIVTDLDCPCALLWTHSDPSQLVSFPDFIALERRADFVAAFRYAVQKLATRTVWNGWRPIKP